MKTDAPCVLREATASDMALVYSSWVQSFLEINKLKIKTGATREDGLPETQEYMTGPALWHPDRYFKHQRNLINAIIPKSKVLVACNPEEESQVYGYIVYRDLSSSLRVVSYCYVKHPFRKFGIARQLFESLGECHVCTHGGVSTRKLIARAGLIFDPMFDLKEVEIAL